MSSQSRSAAPIIVPFTGTAMRRRGGPPPASTQGRLRTGCGSTPGSMARPSRSISIPCLAYPRRQRRKVAQPSSPRDLATNDLMAAVSGEPTECPQEYRAEDGGRQAHIAPECSPARAHRRDRDRRIGRQRGLSGLRGCGHRGLRRRDDSRTRTHAATRVTAVAAAPDHRHRDRSVAARPPECGHDGAWQSFESSAEGPHARRSRSPRLQWSCVIAARASDARESGVATPAVRQKA
jgi:hypothetical protein